ncbi:MAG: TetR/AcrR family transcriptional regulator [Candidatus Binatia bacterium]
MTRSTKSRAPRADLQPRTARGERTRRKIREAANRLFLADGFHDTTVDEIVDAAGVSKGTFYLHFERKEDLLLEYGSNRLQRIREALPDLLIDRSFADAVNEILDLVVRGKEWSRDVTGLALVEMGTSAERLPVEAPHKLIQPLVELAQARGELRTDIPASAIAQFVLRSILGALRDWGLGSEDFSREEALDYAVALVLDAVAVRPPS